MKRLTCLNIEEIKYQACADPDIFLRGGPPIFFSGGGVQHFFSGGVQAKKIHKNAHKMDKNNVFLETSKNSRGGPDPRTPPLDPRMSDHGQHWLQKSACYS